MLSALVREEPATLPSIRKKIVNKHTSADTRKESVNSGTLKTLLTSQLVLSGLIIFCGSIPLLKKRFRNYKNQQISKLNILRTALRNIRES